MGVVTIVGGVSYSSAVKWQLCCMLCLNINRSLYNNGLRDWNNSSHWRTDRLKRCWLSSSYPYRLNSETGTFSCVVLRWCYCMWCPGSHDGTRKSTQDCTTGNIIGGKGRAQLVHAWYTLYACMHACMPACIHACIQACMLQLTSSLDVKKNPSSLDVKPV